MGTYIALIDYTDKGVEAIGDSPLRADAFVAKAAEMGAQVKAQYWTFGGHDGVVILEEVRGERDKERRRAAAAEARAAAAEAESRALRHEVNLWVERGGHVSRMLSHTLTALSRKTA